METGTTVFEKWKPEQQFSKNGKWNNSSLKMETGTTVLKMETGNTVLKMETGTTCSNWKIQRPKNKTNLQFFYFYQLTLNRKTTMIYVNPEKKTLASFESTYPGLQKITIGLLRSNL